MIPILSMTWQILQNVRENIIVLKMTTTRAMYNIYIYMYIHKKDIIINIILAVKRCQLRIKTEQIQSLF